MSNDHRNRTGKATTQPKLLDDLRAKCAPIGKRLGCRRSAQATRAIYKALLAAGNDPKFSAAFAEAVTRTEPTEWLAAREAQSTLASLGVDTSRYALYRLGRKFRSVGQGEVLMNSDGDWGMDVEGAVVKLIVKPGERPKFTVLPLQGRSTESPK